MAGRGRGRKGPQTFSTDEYPLLAIRVPQNFFEGELVYWNGDRLVNLQFANLNEMIESKDIDNEFGTEISDPRCSRNRKLMILRQLILDWLANQ